MVAERTGTRIGQAHYTINVIKLLKIFRLITNQTKHHFRGDQLWRKGNGVGGKISFYTARCLRIAKITRFIGVDKSTFGRETAVATNLIILASKRAVRRTCRHVKFAGNIWVTTITALCRQEEVGGTSIDGEKKVLDRRTDTYFGVVNAEGQNVTKRWIRVGNVLRELDERKEVWFVVRRYMMIMKDFVTMEMNFMNVLTRNTCYYKQNKD
mmetsp:Transcript_10449/g.15716  ORF Transcript_10449/g.15716 Transcript_10449/m.15716 type:complete len:211 (+) Transcript_10449:672-1304(+)